MSYVVAIPARYASTRLPGKPLLDTGGMPMIRRVCLQALKSGASRVIACIDDERVGAALEGSGAEVCLTSPQCSCGTDRLAEMIRTLKLEPDTVVVNVQGDEPLINPTHIVQVAKILKATQSEAAMATLCTPILSVQELFDPNCVKVVCDKRGFALYFSRAPIPYERDNFKNFDPHSGTAPALLFHHYRHIGIYAYKAGKVLDYSALPRQELECAESLEQLRMLNEGWRICVGITKEPPAAGVDTQEDLDKVNAILKAQPQ